MEKFKKPWSHLSKKAIPAPLREIIALIFYELPPKYLLVGGTALSGCYFAHRRSDDINIFVENYHLHKILIKKIKSIKNLQFIHEDSFPAYFHSQNIFKHHSFTIDIVVDKNIFSSLEKVYCTKENIFVPDLKTLLKMKAATLVSRCSEKDLYDLFFIFDFFPHFHIKDLISMGMEIDSGVNAENLCMSLGGAEVSRSACNFSIDKNISQDDIFEKIKKIQSLLLKQFMEYEKFNTNNTISSILEKLKKM